MSDRVKIGVVMPFFPFEVILSLCQRAEKLGFDSIWMGDHMVGHWAAMEALDAWITLAALSIKTERISLGIVTDVLRRHPAIMAQAAVTLDHLSKGRFILGLGAGEAMNIAPYGISFDRPVSRMQESIQIIRRLWSESNITYEGQFYYLTNAELRPKPVQQPSIPIYIAGNSPKTMELTGRHGNGWLPFRLSPTLYTKNLNHLKGYIKKHGRSDEKIDPCLWLFTGVSEDPKQLNRMREIGKRLILFSPKILREFGYEVSPNFDIHRVLITEATDSAIETHSKRIPDGIINEICVIGTPKKCLERFELYIKAGVRHFVLIILNPLSEVEYALMTYSKEILPFIKE